nr:hypothetical protein [Legionella pneumophila]
MQQSTYSQSTKSPTGKKVIICFNREEEMRIPEDLITDSGRHLITDSGVFDHFNDSRCGLSFKGV